MPGDVVLFTEHMEPSLRQLVLEACAHAQLTPHECGEEAGTVNGSFKPAFAIGAVPTGARSIPATIARRLAEQFPAVPLVMLCNEPLVRPSVSLQRGRVTLIGSPLTRDKITAQLRTPVAIPPDEASRNGRDSDTTRALRVREHRGVGWWSACLWRRLPAAPRQEIRPLIGKLSGLGYVGLFPTAPGAILGEGLLETFAQAPGDPDPERSLASLVHRLGGQVAAVWLHPQRRLWLIAAPSHGPEFWLLSPLRLPQRWGLGRSACDPRTGVRSLPASNGDIIAALCFHTAQRETAAEREPAQARAAAAPPATAAHGVVDPEALPIQGGSALLDHLEERMQHDAQLAAALLVELRP